MFGRKSREKPRIGSGGSREVRPEISAEEKLLAQQRGRRRRLHSHLSAYAVLNVAFTALMLAADGEIQAALVVFIIWSAAMALHGLKYRGWMAEHREELRAAEGFMRLEGHSRALRMLGPASRAGGLDPLVVRCEESAELTRERVEILGVVSEEVVEIIERGLTRVRSLLSHRDDLARALSEVTPERLENERYRIQERIRASVDGESRQLYESQLSMLEERGRKASILEGMQERMVAFAESYLAVLANLRLDVAKIKTAELELGPDDAVLSKPVQELNHQVESMNAAIREVSSLVRM